MRWLREIFERIEDDPSSVGGAGAGSTTTTSTCKYRQKGEGDGRVSSFLLRHHFPLAPERAGWCGPAAGASSTPAKAFRGFHSGRGARPANSARSPIRSWRPLQGGGRGSARGAAACAGRGVLGRVLALEDAKARRAARASAAPLAAGLKRSEKRTVSGRAPPPSGDPPMDTIQSPLFTANGGPPRGGAGQTDTLSRATAIVKGQSLGGRRKLAGRARRARANAEHLFRAG